MWGTAVIWLFMLLMDDEKWQEQERVLGGGKGRTLLLQPAPRYTGTSPLHPTKVITVLLSNFFTYIVCITDTRFLNVRGEKS